MTNPKTLVLLISAAMLAGSALAAAGCSREPEPPPVVQYVPPPPPEPEGPQVTPIADLMEALRIDDRVVMFEEEAPSTDEARKAVLEFFDAFARGDHRALAGRMSPLDRRELEAMVESGDWERSTKHLTQIFVRTGVSPNGECAVSIFEVTEPAQTPTEQVQLWYFGPSYDDPAQYEFEAAATPPNMMTKLQGTDWIKAWHDILEEEEALASKLDTEIDLPQKNLDENEGEPTMPTSPSGPIGPVGPTRAPGDGPAPAPRRPPGT